MKKNEFVLAFFLDMATSHHARFRLCIWNKMTVPVLFEQSAFFSCFSCFSWFKQPFFALCLGAKALQAGSLEMKKKTAIISHEKHEKHEKKIKQPTYRLACKSGNPRKRPSSVFQLRPQALNFQP